MILNTISSVSVPIFNIISKIVVIIVVIDFVMSNGVIVYNNCLKIKAVINEFSTL